MSPKEPQPRLTYEEALALIQGSTSEIDRGLRDRRILKIDGMLQSRTRCPVLSRDSLSLGELRPISNAHLEHILVLILNLIVSDSLQKDNVPVERLCDKLSNEHEIPRGISTQVMAWFGEFDNGKWKLEPQALVRELGLGLLRKNKVSARLRILKELSTY